MSKTFTSSFNYQSLDSETSQFVQFQTVKIRGFWRQSVRNIIEIGQCLIAVKARLGHGNFENWLTAEFDWGLWTARKFMQVAEQFKSVNFTETSIDASALYILAAPSTPEEARQEALARAEAGEAINYTTAKKIKEKYSSPQPKPKPKSQPEVQQPTSVIQSLPEGEPASVATPSTPGARQRIKHELPTPGSPIIAIRRYNAPTIEEEESVEKVLPQPFIKLKKFVEKGTFWKLGEKNYIYCGSPNHSRFRESLPEKIALSLAFPLNEEYWPVTPAKKALSSMVWFTRFSDQDDLTLREMVEKALLLSTNYGEPVVFSWLPDIELLFLAWKLDCVFYAADPDPLRCEAAILAWKEKGNEVKKVSGLRV
jgi:hypothetical protein